MLTEDAVPLKYEGGVGHLLGALVAGEVLGMEDLAKGTGKWTTEVGEGQVSSY